MELISTVPDYKIGYVLAYLQGLTADEAEDDAFCEKLYQAYETDPDKGEYISLEDYKKEMKKDQKYIYYVSGDNLDSIKLLPQIEKYRKEEVDVLDVLVIRILDVGNRGDVYK